MKKSTMRFVRILVWTTFILYLLELFFLLFMGYQREYWREFSDWQQALKNMKLVPFETIRAYMQAIKYGHMGLAEPIVNLVGNFLLLMPLAVFLPLFCSRLKAWKPFMVTMLITIFLIELMQFLFMRGVFDIDDFLLNFSGAMAGLLLWKLPPVKWLERAYRGK